jgi:flagellar hook-length control protein FliK
MQQVNSLPINLSQDTEFVIKNESSSIRENNSDFSALVDKHLYAKSEESDKFRQKDIDNLASEEKKGHIIAADSKDDNSMTTDKLLLTEELQLEKQKADKKIATEKTNEDQIETKVSLTESEEFITLLYYSDNALVDTRKQIKQGIEGSQKASNITDKTSESELTLLGEEHSDESSISEHKLKTFISDQGNVTNNDALTRYQQSLSAKQDASNIGKSLPISDINNHLGKGKGKGKDELGHSIHSENDLLKDSKLIQEKPFSQGVGELVNTMDIEQNGKVVTPVKSDITTNVNASSQKHETIIDENISQSLRNEKANNTVMAGIKGLTTESSQTNSSLKAAIIIQQNNIAKQGTAETTTEQSQSDIPKVQSQSDIPKVQSQSDIPKVQSQIDSKNSANNTFSVEESALAENDFELTAKPTNIPLKNDVTQTTNFNKSSVLTDTNNQIKQESNAYNTHEAGVRVEQTNINEMVQTQKNNVQLHQETISIFRKDFAEAIKDKVMLVISQKLQQFDITLDPPEFGNMQVRVNLQGEQAAVNFVVQNQSAKDALDQNMHKLKEMLAEKGVDVGDADVQQQNQQQAETDEKSTQDSGLSNSPSNSSADSSEHILSAELVNTSASGVDYYV